jgi:hypothetical protein
MTAIRPCTDGSRDVLTFVGVKLLVCLRALKAVLAFAARAGLQRGCVAFKRNRDNHTFLEWLARRDV